MKTLNKDINKLILILRVPVIVLCDKNGTGKHCKCLYVFLKANRFLLLCKCKTNS